MTDKYGVPATLNDALVAVGGLRDEIAELRAENEQRKRDIDYLLERQKDQLARADRLITENERLRAALRDEYAGHEAYVDNTPCEAGNFDGGNAQDCEHCQHQQRMAVLEPLISWQT